MNRTTFLSNLRNGLDGLPTEDIDEIVADYGAYFDEAQASGRSDDEVAAALGDPRRLARELRAEAGLRRWENHPSLRNSATALIALGGLAAVDVLVLVPLLFAVALALFVSGLAVFIIGIAGIGTLLSIFKGGHFYSLTSIMLRALAGIGLITASAGIVGLVFLGLNSAVKMLASYARLHYRLLKPKRDDQVTDSGIGYPIRASNIAERGE